MLKLVIVAIVIVVGALRGAAEMGNLAEGDIRHDRQRDPVVGINIWSVYAGGASPAAWERQIERIAGMGFGAVTIVPQFFVNLTTGEVTRDDPTPQPTYGGMTDEALSAAIAKAKARGMLVTISPTLEPANRSIFRGEIAFNDTPARDDNGRDHPEVEARFWETYQAHIERYARAAQAAGADRFNIGAELGNLDTDLRNTDRWARLIAAADAAFKGQLGYTTVHWTFDRPATIQMIYAHPKIDYVSLSAYFPLATPEQAAASGGPGDAAFVAIVEDNVQRLLDDRILPTAKAVGKTVILNEIGTTPFDGAAAQPWDWTLGDRANYDPAEARNIFEGIFRALADRKQQITGVNLWIWGWPGGFAGERFYINDNPTDLPETTFNESKMSDSSRFIRRYLSR